MTQLDFYTYEHSDPTIKTVGELLNSSAYPFKGKSVSEFLSYKDSSGVTNETRIKESFIGREKLSQGSGLNLKLNIGVYLTIPKEKADKSNGANILGKNVKVVSMPDVAFKAKLLTELEADKGYRVIKNSNENTLVNDYPNITVWIWCRALSGKNNQDGQIFDLTPFIESCNTSVTKGGGAFNLELPPITCRMSADGNWVLKKEEIKFYKHDGKINHVSQHSTFEKNAKGKMKRSKYFFHNIISQNDIVFIRYESLFMEQTDRLKDSTKLNISEKDLPNKIYDMIGLVDSSKILYSPESVDVSISIAGRDLTKLIIEDGAYYIPSMYTNPNQAVNNENLRDLSGALKPLAEFKLKTPQQLIKFFIDALASIKIVNSKLFRYYSQTSSIDIDSVLKTRQSNDLEYLKLLEKTRFDAFFAIEQIVKDRFQYETVSSLQKQSIFNKIVDYCEQADNSNKLTIDGILPGFNFEGYDTNFVNDLPWKSFSNIFLPKNSRDINSSCDLNSEDKYLLNLIANYVIKKRNANKDPLPTTSFDEKGIWKIVTLGFDPSINNRTVVDSSLSLAEGSLVNFFRRVCQEPFIEFYSDTYFDRFYFMARVPPFTQNTVISHIEGRVITEENKIQNIANLVSSSVTGVRYSESNTFVGNSMVTVEDSNLIKESLDFDDDNCYTWYHVMPKGAMQGFGNNMAMFYSKPKIFKELVEIYGNKLLQIEDNYVMYNAEQKVENKIIPLSLVDRQLILDLLFIIESNVHLPFTRKGKLTLNGDRRLKRGQYLYYKPTNEVFYIEGVYHSYKMGDSGVDRVTTVDVSRGMILDYIYGVRVDGISEIVSYFNIAKTKINFNSYLKNKQVSETIVSQSIVEEESAINMPDSYAKGLSSNGLQFLVREESGINPGTSYVYKDGDGYSAGYGHKLSPSELRQNPPGSGVTKDQIKNWLISDIEQRERTALSLHPNMYQEEFDAYVDIVYNTAEYATWFENKYRTFSSKLRAYLYDRNEITASNLKNYWLSVAITEAGSGKVLTGLKERRKKEVNMFFSKNRFTKTEQRRVNERIVETSSTTTKNISSVDMDSLYNDIKINKEVLNFFLRRQQLNDSK